jgi:hypothetical protein
MPSFPVSVILGGAAFEARLCAELQHTRQHLHDTGHLLCCTTGSAGDQHLPTPMLPSPMLLSALDVLIAMARAVPAALAATAQGAAGGGTGLADPVGTSSPAGFSGSLRAVQIQHELLEAHRKQVRSLEAACNRCRFGLVVPSQSYNPSGTFLGPGLVGRDGAPASLEAQHCTATAHQMMVGNPLVHGIVEPASLAVGVWGRAVELVLQVLRVDAVVPARPASGHRGLLVKPQQPRLNTHQARRGKATKEVCEADSSSDDSYRSGSESG